MAAAVADAWGEPRAALDVLDAGCGTGWCGPLVRPYARRLTGVDLSPAMVQRAEDRQVYDELVVAELTEYFRGAAGRFDLIISADTLVYFGDLKEVLSAAADALRPGGFLVFTVERAGDDCPSVSGFHLQHHGRYCHAEEYIRTALRDAGLAVARNSPRSCCGKKWTSRCRDCSWQLFGPESPSLLDEKKHNHNDQRRGQ